MLRCDQFEVLLADSLDGALVAPDRKAEQREFAQHLETCAACAAMASEVRSVLSFMQVASDAEPPQELLGKILHATNSGWELKLRGQGVRGWINRAFAPVLRPRFVMGAMLTVMSLTMLTRCAGGGFENRRPTLTAADFDPVRMWTALDGRAHRTWDRAVKGYESIRLVYEIRTQIDDWNDQRTADDETAADAAAKARELKSADTGLPDEPEKNQPEKK